MTSRIAFAVLLLCPFGSGCAGLFHIGTRNLLNEAKLIRDEKFEKIRYACLAHEAWASVTAECPQAYSADYAEGFKAGFVDYLYAGGNGEPLEMPPRRYRHFHAESAAGAKALQDWYAGFRHGAGVAKESGLRQYVVVSLPGPRPVPPPPPPVAGPPLPPPAGGPSPGELHMPAPTPVPPPVMPSVVPPEAPPATKGTAASADPTGTPDSPPETEAGSPGEPTEEGPAVEPPPEEQP